MVDAVPQRRGPRCDLPMTPTQPEINSIAGLPGFVGGDPQAIDASFSWWMRAVVPTRSHAGQTAEEAKRQIFSQDRLQRRPGCPMRLVAGVCGLVEFKS